MTVLNPTETDVISEAFRDVVRAFSCNDGAEPRCFVSEVITGEGDDLYKLGIFHPENLDVSSKRTLIQKTMDNLAEMFIDAGFAIHIDELGMQTDVLKDDTARFLELAQQVQKAEKEANQIAFNLF